MASSFVQVVNDLKYAKVDVNDGGTWKAPKEVWVKYGATWKEPKEVWVNKAGVWTRATTPTRFITFDGSATYLGHATNGNFNNYLTGGTAYTTYQFMVVLAGAGTIRTLFSYGNSTVSYFHVYVGSDNKVHVKSRFNNGTAYDVSHASVLSDGVYYDIKVQVRQSTPNRIIVNINDINGTAVGSQFLSTSFAAFSTNTYGKFIGKHFTNVQYLNGVMLDFYVQGATYAETGTTSDANNFLSSTVGGTTVECGTYDWTIYGGEVIEETG